MFYFLHLKVWKLTAAYPICSPLPWPCWLTFQMFTIVLTTLLNVYLLTFQMFTIELTALLNVYLPGNVFETFAHWNIVHLQVYSISFFFARLHFCWANLFVLHPYFGHYYSWRKKKSDDAQVESQTTKKQQTSMLPSRMYMPLWSNYRNFTTRRLDEPSIPNCLGFRFHPFLYLTPLHTTMKTYTTTKATAGGPGQLGKKEPESPRITA